MSGERHMGNSGTLYRPCSPTMDDIDTYLDSLPPERRDPLRTLDQLVKRAWPRALGDLSTGMPTYHLGGHTFLAFADRKNFMVLHIVHYDLLNVFKHELVPYDHGRSCIRFTRATPGFLHLVDRMVKYCGDQMAQSVYYGRAHKLKGPLKRSRGTVLSR